MGRLENKHRGGVNNEKGAKYEEYYATYRIASLLPSCLDQCILIKSQVEGAYIDDLLIKTGVKHDYFQLKNVQNVKQSWTEIKEDVVSQIQLSIDKKEDFSVTLVYSDVSFNTILPEDIVDYFNFEWFPSTKSILELIGKYNPFKNALMDLSVFENPDDDTLYGLARYILGHWCGIDRQEGLLVSELADSLKCSNLNTILDSNRDISLECKEILDRITGFTYAIKGKNIVWGIEHSRNNSTEWTKGLDDRIICQVPKSAKDIFKML